MNKPITQERIAEDLIFPLFRCIDESYKSKYNREIWEHFENAIRSASYTGSSKEFLSNIQKRIPITIQAQYSKDIISVIQHEQEEEILEWLRSETTYIVLLARIQNQKRKTDLEEKYLNSNQPQTIGQEDANINF